MACAQTRARTCRQSWTRGEVEEEEEAKEEAGVLSSTFFSRLSPSSPQLLLLGIFLPLAFENKMGRCTALLAGLLFSDSSRI